MKIKQSDLIIIGGGIMGLFTAYYASQFSKKIILIEKREIGNRFCASSGYSRSIRNDYLDPYYSLMASEAQRLWKELEKKGRRKFFIECGCLNIAQKKTTPMLEQTYAYKSNQILKTLGFKSVYFSSKRTLQSNFPQFDTDIACLDVNAGFLYIPTILEVLKTELRNRGVKIYENTEVTRIKKEANNITVFTSKKHVFISSNVTLAVGAWSIELLNKINGAFLLKLPIIPIEQKLDYFAVPTEQKDLYSSKNMPVFAYLDVGIYGHPLYGKTPGLKVAYFDPMGAKLVKSLFTPEKQNRINNNIDFIRNCLPGIKSVRIIEEENNYYDMTPDNDFVVDELPGLDNIFIAGGFCGTGFKFAPLIGKIIAEMVFRKKTTIYNIARFSAKRFGKISNLSFLKTLPMYKNFLAPRNWKYLKKGIEALLMTKKLP